MEPTLAGFLTFIRDVMGITTAQLPDDSAFIPASYYTALDIVNVLIDSMGGPGSNPAVAGPYAQAVYNLGGDRLLNWAQDPSGAPNYASLDGVPYKFFAYCRKTMNLTGFTPGVIQSTNDLTTGGSYVVPEAFKNLTIRDLQNLKTPYGQAYLAIAQDYGPTEWGLS